MFIFLIFIEIKYQKRVGYRIFFYFVFLVSFITSPLNVSISFNNFIQRIFQWDLVNLNARLADINVYIVNNNMKLICLNFLVHYLKN